MASVGATEPRFPEVRPLEDQPHGLEPLCWRPPRKNHEALGLVGLDLWHETEWVMGWNVAEAGLEVAMDRHISTMVREDAGEHREKAFCNPPEWG